jgi:hypothetical protein
MTRRSRVAPEQLGGMIEHEMMVSATDDEEISTTPAYHQR